MNRNNKRMIVCVLLAFSIVLLPMPAGRVYAAEHAVVQSVSESLVIEKAGAEKKGAVRRVVVSEKGPECIIRWNKPKGKRKVEGYEVIVRSGNRAYNDHVFTDERSYSFDEELKAGMRIKVYIRPYYRDDRNGKRLSFTFSVRKKPQVYTTESPEVPNVYAYAEIFKNMTVTREDILEKADEIADDVGARLGIGNVDICICSMDKSIYGQVRSDISLNTIYLNSTFVRAFTRENDTVTDEYRMRFVDTIAHEVRHLYQYRLTASGDDTFADGIKSYVPSNRDFSAYWDNQLEEDAREYACEYTKEMAGGCVGSDDPATEWTQFVLSMIPEC